MNPTPPVMLVNELACISKQLYIHMFANLCLVSMPSTRYLFASLNMSNICGDDVFGRWAEFGLTQGVTNKSGL